MAYSSTSDGPESVKLTARSTRTQQEAAYHIDQQSQYLDRFTMPQFVVTSHPPAQFRIGQTVSVEAEYTSSNLKTGLLYMANIDLVGPDGTESGRACPPQTCAAVQTPAAGKPQRLNFVFRNLAVRQEGAWHFHIALHSRKEHLGNEFSYVNGVYTRQFTVKKS